MPKYTITLIPGDGIGSEITNSVQRIIDAAKVDICWESYKAGKSALEVYGDLLSKIDDLQGVLFEWRD